MTVMVPEIKPCFHSEDQERKNPKHSLFCMFILISVDVYFVAILKPQNALGLVKRMLQTHGMSGIFAAL